MKKGFSKLILVFLLIVIGIIVVMGLYETEIIRTYKIKDFEINAVVNKDGSMTVKEKTLYRFNGKYNGITITIPENINSNYYNKMTENSINDSILEDYWYNNKGIKAVKIYVADENGNRIFNEVGTAKLGADSVYTVTNDNGYTTYKIFEPSKNENKTFVIEYTLENVAVSHNDCLEIWWNFIGGGVECSINKLRINISTPFGNIIDGYIHSNESGKINNINKNSFNASVSSIKKNEFVGIRLVFPKSNVQSINKVSGIDALDVIKSQEESYKEKSNLRIELNILAILLAVGLFIYWLYLIVRYEKEFVYTPDNIDELRILDKYNPMIAACIAQNRDMHPRDILAVLINLVNKKVINLESINSFDTKKGNANITYKLTKNEKFFKVTDNTLKLDDIERNVLDIFFEGNNSINLEQKLIKFKTNDKIANKVKKLDEMVAKKLEEIGANFIGVPRRLLVLNNIIAIICIIFVIGVIAFNIALGFSTLSTTSEQIKDNVIMIGSLFAFVGIASLPLVLYGIVAILKLINSIKKLIAKISFKLTSKKLTQSILQSIIIFTIIFIVEFIFFRQSYIIICTILFMIAIILILTDNLMSSHSMKVMNDFFALKMLEDKIKNGSLLDEKEIKDQVLWEKYLSFAIALGVGDVAKYIKNIPVFDYFEDSINKFDALYDLYCNSRDDLTDKNLEKFEKSISKIMETSSSGGYSGGVSYSSGGFSGGSSFGGGGFSGGGRWWWPEEVHSKICKNILHIFFSLYIIEYI